MNTERREAQSPMRYGIRLGHLDDDTFNGVLQRYHEAVGVYRPWIDVPAGERIKRCYPQGQSIAAAVREILRKNLYWEYRFGSRLTDHAKLVIRDAESRSTDDQMLIRFLFDPNIVEGDEADQLKASFKNSVDEFFVERGIAVPLGT